MKYPLIYFYPQRDGIFQEISNPFFANFTNYQTMILHRRRWKGRVSGVLPPTLSLADQAPPDSPSAAVHTQGPSHTGLIDRVRDGSGAPHLMGRRYVSAIPHLSASLLGEGERMGKAADVWLRMGGTAVGRMGHWRGGPLPAGPKC